MSNKKNSYSLNSQEQFSKKISSLYNVNKLSKIRILQKNIVYIIGLPLNLASSELLSKYEFLGQYGEIKKIIVNKNGYNQNKNSNTTYSAYITYSSFEEASLALLTIDNNFYEGHLLRTSYGTTKYCNCFIKGIECINKDCLYMHQWATESDMIFKEDICSNKQIFYLHKKIAVSFSEIFSEKKKQLLLMKGNEDKNLFLKKNTLSFPTVDTLYEKNIIYNIQKEILFENKRDSIFHKNSSNVNNDFNFEELNDNSMEYVLVKEPYKKKRKYKNFNSKKYSKFTNKNEDNQNINLKNNLNSSDSTTTSLDSSEKNSNNNLYNSNSGSSNCSKSIYHLYQQHEKSRFDFVNNNETNGLNIPKFIINIINIKYCSFSFFTRMKNRNKIFIDDNILFSKEENYIKKWNK